MEKLEREQKGLRDAYNQEITGFNEYLYHEKLKVPRMDWLVIPGEKQEHAVMKLEVHSDQINIQAIQRHMKGKNGPWYCHANDPRGCPICPIIAMNAYLIRLLKWHIKDTKQEEYPQI